MLDITKPVEVFTKTPLIGEGGNYYPPGHYRPGELPAQFLIESYCRNVGVTNIPGTVPDFHPVVPELVSTPNIPAVSKAVNHDLIDINTADINKIMEVKGIGTAIANSIIVERDAKGNYKNVADLVGRIEKLVPLTTTIENRFSFN